MAPADYARVEPCRGCCQVAPLELTQRCASALLTSKSNPYMQSSLNPQAVTRAMPSSLCPAAHIQQPMPNRLCSTAAMLLLCSVLCIKGRCRQGLLSAVAQLAEVGPDLETQLSAAACFRLALVDCGCQNACSRFQQAPSQSAVGITNSTCLRHP